MSNIGTTSRVGRPRENQLADARHQNSSHGAACRRQASRRASGASTAAGRATAGPNAQRAGRAKPGRLDLLLGHFGTHTGGIEVKPRYQLAITLYVHTDNHGAAPRAAQGRSRDLRVVARHLAQCADGRRTPGLPGWAHRVGLPAGALGSNSVTRYGIRASAEIRHAGRSHQAPEESQCALPLRCAQRGRACAALETVPRKGLGGSLARRKGVAHG